MTTVSKGGMTYDIREVSVSDVPNATRKGVWSEVSADLRLRLDATTDPNRMLMLTFNDIKTADKAKMDVSKWFFDHYGSGTVSVFKRENRVYVQRGPNWPGKATP